MGINYCDAMMYWKAKERGIRFDKVLTLGHETLWLHPSEVSIFRDAYRKAFESPSGTPLDDYQWRDYADHFWAISWEHHRSRCSMRRPMKVPTRSTT